MLDEPTSTTPLVDGDAFVDNYGTPEGLPSARALAAELLGVDAANVIVSGSSSLNLMHDLVTHGFTNGVAGCDPWYRQGDIKWLCPAPGYDRHFAVTAHLGIKNVPIEMRADGPDMDTVQRLVETDASVKGIWCVPKYANPTGITYTDEVVRRFAALKPAAPDFRIYWDNAYCVHGFADADDQLLPSPRPAPTTSSTSSPPRPRSPSRARAWPSSRQAPTTSPTSRRPSPSSA